MVKNRETALVNRVKSGMLLLSGFVGDFTRTGAGYNVFHVLSHHFALYMG